MKITESPRDAMQGLKRIIPTTKKIDFINSLFKVGFDVIDVGSFVSQKAVPQMADTENILRKIKIDNSKSKISILAGNSYYASKIADYENVTYINYPFAISEIFLKKNLKTNFEKSIRTIDKIINICIKKNKIPLISVSSALGNPYGDEWNTEILLNWINILIKKDLNILSIADTNASGNADTIAEVFSELKMNFPNTEFNFHLHTEPNETFEKINAAYKSGCRNFDTVFNGMGGCPMTGKELIANVNTLSFVNFLDKKNVKHKLNFKMLMKANKKAIDIFG